ncbi:MAG TPA: response regulator [Candidatus Paceibacterota bacterium]|nr:response regulator [Candidatus Paceibacterota bacterium]
MSSAEFNVLLVEDDPQMHEVLAEILREDHVCLHGVREGVQATEAVIRTRSDLVLLDLGLPDMNGFEVLTQIKARPEVQHVPVIVLTAWNSPSDKLRGFELGAADYLTKPFDAAELRARVRAALKTKRLQDDLTQANRELLAARVAAEASARAKSDFLASMSHEIRTPMNGIIAMAGLLRETPLNNEQQGYVETIYSSSESLLTIVNDILDYSRIESGRLELEQAPFDLRTCIEDALDLMGVRAAEKKLDLAYEIESGIPPCLVGDVTRLRQVLVNLLSNGVKFTHAGEVVLQVKVLAQPPTAAGRAPWHLQFSVRDTGIGIPVDRLARLFKSFSQADASTTRHYGGTGLGLAICKRLVELMGGKIWVESVSQRGSTFHFILPLRAAPAAQPAPGPLCAGSHSPEVLIVDDNATLCRILAGQLAAWGLSARSTSRATEALEWLAAGARFDLALVDFRLGDRSGLTLAGQMRNLPGGGRLPLVLMTPMGIHPDINEATRLKLAGCVTKPIRLAHLRETLQGLLSGAQPAPVRCQGPQTPGPECAGRLPLRILLCDDNIVNQKVASRLLQQIGYRADLAANGVEALAALERQAYDLIFMDVMMPEMGGLEATRLIRQRQRERRPNHPPWLVIVAMTASAMSGDREKCLAAGMDDYLAKPVRLEDIRNIIERWGPKVAANQAEPALAAVDCRGADRGGEPAPPAAGGNAPVDMDRLLEFTDGNPDSLRELVTLYLQQTGEQFEQLEAAVEAGKAGEVRRLAHSCAGASATCGMRDLVPLLRELERQGAEGVLRDADKLLQGAKREFQRIESFLQSHLSCQPELTVTHST